MAKVRFQIRDPDRNVPRATLIGMLIAGGATILTCTVVLGLLPADVLATSSAPMADAASRIWGSGAGVAVGVVATVSVFGALNGWVFQYSILLSTAAALLPYAMTAVAWWKLNPGSSLAARLVAIGAFAYSVWALIGTGGESLAWGGVLLLAGLPVYLWQRRLVPATSRP